MFLSIQDLLIILPSFANDAEQVMPRAIDTFVESYDLQQCDMWQNGNKSHVVFLKTTIIQFNQQCLC